MKTKSKFTSVEAVFTELAGKKLPEVTELANRLIEDGRSMERAWADALEELRCPNVVKRRADEVKV